MREGEITEGLCAGPCARVNDVMLSTWRLQLCLSKQQCRRVEHESQLAAAWQGLAFLCCFLQFIVLLSVEGKEEWSKITEKEEESERDVEVSGSFSFQIDGI